VFGIRHIKVSGGTVGKNSYILIGYYYCKSNNGSVSENISSLRLEKTQDVFESYVGDGYLMSVHYHYYFKQL